MKKNKAVIALFVVLGLLVAGVFLWIHLEEKHQEELIQAAQNTELGEGVTLLQGVRAYFGDSGDWDIFGDDYTIYLDVGRISDGHVLSATFEVNEKTGQLDILTFVYDFHEVSQDELYDLIDAMIQAAKR